jgi:hypothetical protein
MSVLKAASSKPILDTSDLKNLNTIDEKRLKNSLAIKASSEKAKKIESPSRHSLNMSNDILENVEFTSDINSPSTDLMPFNSEPSSLMRSSSYMNLNNCLKRKTEKTETNLKFRPDYQRRHHRYSICDSNPSKSKHFYENTMTPENFLEKHRDQKENSYKHFIESLNCDTNCSCAYHKDSTKHSRPPSTPLNQYHHHPYFHHNSFDQNLRLSQLNLLSQTPLKPIEKSKSFGEKLNEEILEDKKEELLKEYNEKNASRSLFEKVFMIILSFFGNF